jgi:membrane protease YdiL (CAAX protease family)
MVTLRVLEFLLLFIAAPAVFTYTRHRIPAIPMLWVLTGCCLFILLRDSAFDRTHLWNTAALPPQAAAIGLLFAVSLALGLYLVRRFTPNSLFDLPRTRPWLWSGLMLLYPVLSVYPQGIVYRAFVFARYRDVFTPGWAIIAASAVAFAWAHIVFRNWVALLLTALGGVIFGYRYWQTGSLFASSIEHALYGCAAFTIGLGHAITEHQNRRQPVGFAQPK